MAASASLENAVCVVTGSNSGVGIGSEQSFSVPQRTVAKHTRHNVLTNSLHEQFTEVCHCETIIIALQVLGTGVCHLERNSSDRMWTLDMHAFNQAEDHLCNVLGKLNASYTTPGCTSSILEKYQLV
jgi:hypothetical protein